MKDAIETDVVIKRGLARGLVNIRALARQIREGTAEQYSLEAIVSAIRRYPVQESLENSCHVGRQMIKLTLKNKLVGFTLDSDPSILSLLNEVSLETDYKLGDTLRFVKGFKTIRVEMDEKNAGRVLDAVPKRNIQQVNRGLSEIIIFLAEESAKTLGVIASITTEVTMNGINIIDFISCDQEMILVVFERDALKTYDVLSKMSEVSPDDGVAAL